MTYRRKRSSSFTAGSGIFVDDIGVMEEGGSVDVVDTVVLVDVLTLEGSRNITPLWRSDNPMSQVNRSRRMFSNV